VERPTITTGPVARADGERQEELPDQLRKLYKLRRGGPGSNGSEQLNPTQSVGAAGIVWTGLLILWLLCL
jgi:hypothetical protein